MKIKKEIIRYLIVTPFIGVADFGIYFLLIHIKLPYSVSKAISYIIANGIGYLFNKYWIFKRESKEAFCPEGERYLMIDVALFVCNILTNQGVLYLWPHAVFVAVATASILTAMLSFIGKKFWVFRTSSV